MKKNRVLCVVMSAVFLLSAAPVFARGARGAQPQVDLLIGAAMSLRDVAEDLAAAYRLQNPNVGITFTFASSGALQSQIEAGAPIVPAVYDVFLCAIKEMRSISRTQKNVAEKKSTKGVSPTGFFRSLAA